MGINHFKAAVIGCGHRAAAHIEAYRHLNNAKVAACCAPSGVRRDPLAQKYGLRAYADAAEMIREEKPDVVHVITWPDTRVELMTLVSELGVPLCTTEKPIATTVKDWRALNRLAAATRTKFAVCHQFRWQPHLVNCQEAIRSGRLGAVKFLDMSAGMNIMGQGTHTLNYGLSLIGDPNVVQVFGNVHGWDVSDPGHPAPLASEAHLTFANGVRGLWTSGPVSPRCGDPGTVWQHVRVAAYADRGRVNYEEFGKWDIVGPDGAETGHYGGMDAWQHNNLLAQAGFYRAMFRWAEDDAAAPGTNLRQSLHECAVVLALYQSALTRQPVELNGFDPPDDLVERLTGNGEE